MDKITDFLRLLKLNHSTDIIYFERIVEKEINKPIELFVENGKIAIYHKVTGTKIGDYTPSDCFTELANAFIIFERHKIKSLMFIL